MSRRPGNVRNKRQLPDQHTQKYHPGKDPLEQEASLYDIRPLARIEHKRIMDVVNQMLQDPKLTTDEKKALRMYKANVSTGGVKETVQQEFLRDFWGWLMGRGTDEDHAKTWWGRQSLADDHEIATYIDLFVTKMHDFRVKLKLLEVRRPLGINQAYLYYKYIVRGEGTDASNFLDDWQIFMDEFKTAREFGQDWMDKEQWVHPHETAPYGDMRAQMSQSRSERLFRKDVKNMSQGLGDQQPDYDDDTEDDAPPPPPTRRTPAPPPTPPTAAPPPASQPATPTISTNVPMQPEDADGTPSPMDTSDVITGLERMTAELEKRRTEEELAKAEKKRRKDDKGKEEAGETTPVKKPPPKPPKMKGVVEDRPINPSNKIAAAPKVHNLRKAQQDVARSELRKAEDKSRKLAEEARLKSDLALKLQQDKAAAEKAEAERKQALTAAEAKEASEKAEKLRQETEKVNRELAVVKSQAEQLAREKAVAEEGLRQAEQSRELEKTLREADAREHEKTLQLMREGEASRRKGMLEYLQRIRDQNEAFQRGLNRDVEKWKADNQTLVNDILLNRNNRREGGDGPALLADQIKEEEALRMAKTFQEVSDAVEKVGGDYNKALDVVLRDRQESGQAMIDALKEATGENIRQLAETMSKFTTETAPYEDIIESYLQNSRKVFNDIAESTSSLNPQRTKEVMSTLEKLRQQALDDIMVRFSGSQRKQYRARSEFHKQQLEKWKITQMEEMDKKSQEMANRKMQEIMPVVYDVALETAAREHQAKMFEGLEEFGQAAENEETHRRLLEESRRSREAANQQDDVLIEVLDEAGETVEKIRGIRKRDREALDNATSQIPLLEAAEAQIQAGVTQALEGERAELKEQKIDLEEKVRMEEEAFQKHRTEQAEAWAREKQRQDQEEAEAQQREAEKAERKRIAQEEEDIKEARRREEEEARHKAIEDKNERQKARIEADEARQRAAEEKQIAQAEKAARKAEKKKADDERKAANRARKEAERAAREAEDVAERERLRAEAEASRRQLEEKKAQNKKELQESQKRQILMAAQATATERELAQISELAAETAVDVERHQAKSLAKDVGKERLEAEAAKRIPISPAELDFMGKITSKKKGKKKGKKREEREEIPEGKSELVPSHERPDEEEERKRRLTEA